MVEGKEADLIPEEATFARNIIKGVYDLGDRVVDNVFGDKLEVPFLQARMSRWKTWIAAPMAAGLTPAILGWAAGPVMGIGAEVVKNIGRIQELGGGVTSGQSIILMDLYRNLHALSYNPSVITTLALVGSAVGVGLTVGAAASLEVYNVTRMIGRKIGDKISHTLGSQRRNLIGSDRPPRSTPPQEE